MADARTASVPALPPFGSVKPMLAVEGKPFDSPDFLFEPKWDGFRALTFCTGPADAVRLQSRNGHDLTARFPELQGLGAVLPRGIYPALLDGELVALRRGRPDFHALQQRMGLPFETEGVLPGDYPGRVATSTDPDAPVQLIFVVFDLLFLRGQDLRHQPLSARRAQLVSLFGHAATPSPPLILSPAVLEEGVLLYETSVVQGFEGVVGKRLTSRYQAGRSRDWIKARVRPELEVVVGGFLCKSPSAPPKRRLSSLLVGLYDVAGILRYVGKVGSGWSEEEAETLTSLLQQLQTDGSPFTPAPRTAGDLTLAWTEPLVVASVAYREWTPLGLLRQPTWKGLRPDKQPMDCRLPDSLSPAFGRGGEGT